jgi:hypothetical protein
MVVIGHNPHTDLVLIKVAVSGDGEWTRPRYDEVLLEPVVELRITGIDNGESATEGLVVGTDHVLLVIQTGQTG